MKKVMFIMLAAAGVMSGCQSADPASRSNRTRYGDIVANVYGEGNSVSIEIGDGLYASADGGGDATTSTPTQTTETKPEIAAAWGGASAGTGGAKPTSGLTDTVIAAWQKLTSGQKLTAQEAAEIKGCVEGNCE